MAELHNDILKTEREMSFESFVSHLFDFARDPSRSGLYVQRVDGNMTKINIIPFNNKIIIKMDDIEMGHFEEMNTQEYKCSFHQKNRPHIHKGLNPNELIMKSICNHDLVLFYDA